MDDIQELKYRVYALESTLRRQDKLLKVLCKLLANPKTDPELKKAADAYLKVFDEELTAKS